MFDVTTAFSRQFTPVDGGYVYYPFRTAGGKLVTAAEYERLVADWERVAGRRGRWKAVGLLSAAILLWVFVSQALALPEWADSIILMGSVGALSGWIYWASLAPRRLVRHRPDIAPPRLPSEARREARAALNWPFVLLVLFASGTIFVGHLTTPEASPRWWAWVIGSGLFFVGYFWLAIQKLNDRP